MLKRIARPCAICPQQYTCSKKRMEGVGILERPNLPMEEETTQPLLQHQEYRQIKIDTDTAITIDLEKMKNSIEESIYKNLHSNFLINGG